MSQEDVLTKLRARQAVAEAKLGQASSWLRLVESQQWPDARAALVASIEAKRTELELVDPSDVTLVGRLQGFIMAMRHLLNLESKSMRAIEQGRSEVADVEKQINERMQTWRT